MVIQWYITEVVSRWLQGNCLSALDWACEEKVMGVFLVLVTARDPIYGDLNVIVYAGHLLRRN